jgi:hypothetical protein
MRLPAPSSPTAMIEGTNCGLTPAPQDAAPLAVLLIEALPSDHSATPLPAASKRSSVRRSLTLP